MAVPRPVHTNQAIVQWLQKVHHRSPRRPRECFQALAAMSSCRLVLCWALSPQRGCTKEALLWGRHPDRHPRRPLCGAEPIPRHLGYQHLSFFRLRRDNAHDPQAQVTLHGFIYSTCQLASLCNAGFANVRQGALQTCSGCDELSALDVLPRRGRATRMSCRQFQGL